jgi:hypothetical protein
MTGLLVIGGGLLGHEVALASRDRFEIKDEQGIYLF